MNTNPYNSTLLHVGLLLLLMISCTKDPEINLEEEEIRYITFNVKDNDTGLPLAQTTVSLFYELNGKGTYGLDYSAGTLSNGKILYKWYEYGQKITSLRLCTKKENYVQDTFYFSRPTSDTTVNIKLKKVSNNIIGYNGTQSQTGKARIINGQFVLPNLMKTDSLAVGQYPLGIGQYNAIWSYIWYYSAEVFIPSFHFSFGGIFDDYEYETDNKTFRNYEHASFSGFTNQGGINGKIEITRINWQDSVVWGYFQGATALHGDASQQLYYSNGHFDSLSFTFISGASGAARPNFYYTDEENRIIRHRDIIANRNDTALIVSAYNYGEGFSFTLPLNVLPGTYSADELKVNLLTSEFGFNTPKIGSSITISSIDTNNHRLKGTFNIDFEPDIHFKFQNGGFDVQWE